MQPQNNKNNMTLRSRARSFGYAINGLVKLVTQEANMRIHMLAAIVAVIAGAVVGLTATKWIALVFAISLVWMAEAFNTAIENLCDLVCNNEYHPVIKTIKDISAAAVLIAAAASVIIALFIFL